MSNILISYPLKYSTYVTELSVSVEALKGTELGKL